MRAGTCGRLWQPASGVCRAASGSKRRTTHQKGSRMQRRNTRTSFLLLLAQTGVLLPHLLCGLRDIELVGAVRLLPLDPIGKVQLPRGGHELRRPEDALQWGCGQPTKREERGKRSSSHRLTGTSTYFSSSTQPLKSSRWPEACVQHHPQQLTRCPS
jgi:hypothetical protein